MDTRLKMTLDQRIMIQRAILRNTRRNLYIQLISSNNGSHYTKHYDHIDNGICKKKNRLGIHKKYYFIPVNINDAQKHHVRYEQ